MSLVHFSFTRAIHYGLPWEGQSQRNINENNTTIKSASAQTASPSPQLAVQCQTQATNDQHSPSLDEVVEWVLSLPGTYEQILSLVVIVWCR